MTEPKPQSIKDLFIACSRLGDEQEQRRFLDEACEGDEALKEEVLALLFVSDNNIASFLEHTCEDGSITVAYPRPKVSLGTRIGPYIIREQIGEGGMGVVYVAEQQEPVRRQVALKIIKPGLDSREVVARFEAERQALALMDHPNVSRIHDAGATESGRPYFAMELVRGIPITKYCDKYNLSIPGRLKLFVNVCRGVQHAHLKGIIHRDLKPSNVLVTRIDGQGVPKVIDFGVAKATNQQLTQQTIYTQFSQMLGTPLYMSPEQAELSGVDIDVRTDIYSLGVLLYEVLTGSTPFDRQRFENVSFDEIRRVIREDEPQRPSDRVSTLKAEALTTVSQQRGVDPMRISQTLRGELDWLVMKSLDKDRSRRYESASALAADVERFLNHEPVEACPPSVVYRFRKFARRNKTALSAATLVFVVLVFGIAFSAWQAIQANAARDSEALQRQRAAANFQKALDAVDQMLTRVGQEQLADVPYMEQVRRQILDDALKFYQSLLQDNPDDSRTQFETACAQLRAAQIYQLLSDPSAALKACDEATAILGSLSRQDPTNLSYQEQLATAYERASWSCWSEGRISDAQLNCDRAIAILEPLAMAHPDRFQGQLAAVQTLFGRLLNTIGNHLQAVKVLSDCLPVHQERFSESPSNWWTLAVNYEQLGIAFRGLGRLDDAKTQFMGAKETASIAREYRPSDTERLFFLCLNSGELAMAHRRLGEFDSAIVFDRNGIELAMKLVDWFPTIPRYRVAIATRQTHLIETLVEAGRIDEAAQVVARQNPETVDEYITRAATFQRLRQHDLALADYEKVVSITDESGNDTGLRKKRALAYDQIARILELRERSAEAEEAANRGITILKELRLSNPGDEQCLVSLASLLFHRLHLPNRSRKEKLQDAEQSMAIFQQLVDAGGTRHVGSLGLLSLKVAELLPEGSPRASELIADAMQIPLKFGIVPHPATYIRHGQLAEQRGELADAEELYRRGIEGHRLASESGDRTGKSMLSESLSLLGRLLHKLGRPEEGDHVHKESIEIVRALYEDYGNVPWTNWLLRQRFEEYIKDAHTRQQRKNAELLIAECVSQWPESSGLHLIRAEWLSGLEDPEASLNAAIEEFPEQYAYYKVRGSMFAASGDSERALEDYSLALKFVPGSRDTYGHHHSISGRLSELHLQAEQYQKAIDVLDPVCNGLSQAWWLYKRRAEAHFGLHHFTEALADLNTAFEMNAGDVSTLNWIRADRVANCDDKAFQDGVLELADRAIARLDVPVTRTARARILAALGQDEQAQVDFEKAIELEPGKASAHNELAWHLANCANLSLRDSGRAVAEARKAVELAPTVAAFWNTMGVALYRDNDWNDAVAALTKSVELDDGPNLPFNAFALSMCYWHLGQEDLARDWRDRGARWMDDKQTDDNLLRRLQSEADELIQITTVEQSDHGSN